MPGKDPHRPEGKTADAEHQRRLGQEDRKLEQDIANAPPPSRYPAEEQIGGSRPGVPSRVKDAIAERDG